MKRALVIAVAASFAASSGALGALGLDCEGGSAGSWEGRAAAECLYRSVTGPAGARAAAELERLAAAHPENPWFIFYLGNLRWGETEKAEILYRVAAEGFAATSDAEGEVLARGNRSRLLFRLGRLEESAAEAEAAYERGMESAIPIARAHGSVVLAEQLFQEGQDLLRARELLLAAQRVSEVRKSPHVLKTCLYTLANVTLAIGDAREAARAFEELVAVAERIDDPWLNASARYGLTRVMADRFADEPTEGRRQEVLRSVHQTLAAAQRAGHQTVAAKAHWVLGVMLPWKDAREHLELCEQAAPVDRELSLCLSSAARRLAAVDPARARKLASRALRLAEASGDPWNLAFAWRERMRMGWAIASADEAVAGSWAMLDRIETLRDLQPDGSDVQAGLFATWTDDYYWFAGRLLEEARATGRDDLLGEVFAVSERLRARALTDWLRAAGKDGAEPAAASAARVRGFEFASLVQVQRALGPREALLAFQVAPWKDLAGDFGGGSWVIAVTRRTVRAYPLPGRRDLRQAIDLYTGLFEQRDGSEAAPSAHLFRQLLAPALEELPTGVDRLILVPDDALHRLPFGALRPAPEAPPLAATHRITVAPSASLWLGWRRGGREAKLAGHADRSGAAALVLAAPVVDGSAASGRESGAPIGPGLPPLVHARREGRAIAAALGRGTELASGAAASEDLLTRGDLSRFGILHLAAHAVTDETHPERSAVVLAPGVPGRAGDAADGATFESRREGVPAAGDGSETGRLSWGAAEDGLLRAGEIARLDLGGKLVVLSSCRSAAGTVLRGEGVMSLGRAFFQAGARTVVASLWPVRDDEAAALFEDFYRHLARGETVAAALQAAQAERIAAGAPASAWAAFVVLGDGDLVPVALEPPGDLGLRWAYVAAGATGTTLLLVIAAVALGRRLAALVDSRRPGPERLSDLAAASPPVR